MIYFVGGLFLFFVAMTPILLHSALTTKPENAHWYCEHWSVKDLSYAELQECRRVYGATNQP